MSWFRLISPALKKQRYWLLTGAVLMLTSLAAAVVLLGLAGWFITASAMSGLGLLAAVNIFTPGAGIRLAALVRTLARYGERLVTHQATFRLLADIRLDLFRRLLTLDEIQLRRLRRGDTLTRLTADVETLDHLYSGVLGPIAAAVVLSLAVAGVFGLLAGGLAVLPPLAVLVAGLGAVALTGRWGREPSRLQGRLEPQLRSLATEGLEGLESLRAFDRVDWQQDRIERCSTSLVDLHRRLNRLDAIGQGLATLVGLVGVWLTLVIGLLLHHAGIVSGPVAVLLVLVMLGLTESWQPLPSAWRRLARCRIAAERVSVLADRQPLLSRPGKALKLPDNNQLELIDVTFGYKKELLPVIERFSLTVRAGERVVLTGPSGGGKTTLALLLMRQIDPDSGRVLLGGRDLRQLDLRTLRQRIGYLPQRPAIFRDTLAANLRLARPDAHDQQLAQALELAGLKSFLQRLPDGLSTWLDEAGANLSGGEMRRIALARLMLCDPGVVILDEPTTGLDQASAQATASALDRWLDGRTTILISHDPTTLPAHDRLIRISGR